MNAPLIAFALLAATPQPRHPLDSLTGAEVWTVREALRAAGRLTEGTRVTSIELKPLPKAEVLAWKPGTPARRQARVAASRGLATFEAVVDLTSGTVSSWRELPGAIASLTSSEHDAIQELVESDARFVEGLRKRGVTDLETLDCYGNSPGYFGTPEEAGKKLVVVRCWDRRGTYNSDARPIDGLYAYVDVVARKLLRVVEGPVVPIPRGGGELDAPPPTRDQPPIRVEQPLGPGYTRTGDQFAWQSWRFHVRLENRRGLVVSLVRYADGERLRSVLYEGSLSEIFVPYMDPAEGWYNQTFLDLGEQSDALLNPLEPNEDCPAGALYLDGTTFDEHAVPRPRRKLACLFEREAGQVAWRHLNWLTGGIDSRHGRDLVLRGIANVGNYDYVFDWVFQQDGSLRVVVGATGVLNVKAVGSRNAGDRDAAKDGAYGRFVADHTLAVNHDHFFSFRLDLDVDGTANSFVVDRLTPQRLPEGSLRKSLWTVDSQTAKTEKGALRDRHEPGLWRFVNKGVKGPMGYPVSYQLRAGHSADALLSDDDYPQRRAGFTRHALWVTPYRPEEVYAAGDFPSQSRGGDGLPAWTAADRPIEDTDLVAWHTVGMHHVVRAEDWPVMPVVWHEFELRPFDFFERNPALDLPTSR
jgi:primary-amine oxidase